MTADDIRMASDKESSYTNMSEIDGEEARYVSCAPNFSTVRYLPRRCPELPNKDVVASMRYNAELLEKEAERLEEELAETNELCKKVLSK